MTTERRWIWMCGRLLRWPSRSSDRWDVSVISIAGRAAMLVSPTAPELVIFFEVILPLVQAIMVEFLD